MKGVSMLLGVVLLVVAHLLAPHLKKSALSPAQRAKKLSAAKTIEQSHTNALLGLASIAARVEI
jgi:hypothetical protein